MSPIRFSMSIRKVEGEVMLHDGGSGWVRAHPGMVFPPNSEVTVKTGLSGRVELIDTRGELVSLPGNSLKVISDHVPGDDAKTQPYATISVRDLLSGRISPRPSLVPAI